MFVRYVGVRASHDGVDYSVLFNIERDAKVTNTIHRRGIIIYTELV